VDKVTISAGVAELTALEGPAAAIARADERLYEAKNGGRNQVR
jgi:PleD family two-component response regulator